MADIFSVDTARSLDSELVTEAIKEGEPVTRASGGGLNLLDVTSDTEVDYLCVHQRTGDHNPRYDTEYESYSDLYTYEPASAKANESFDDRAPILPLVDKDVVRSYSIEDDTEPSPSFTENDEVGYVDFGNGPRLVPAGYTDSGGTVYGDGGTGDFVSFGNVDRLPDHKKGIDGFGELVPVRVEK